MTSSNSGSEVFEWDLSNIDTSVLPDLDNSMDLYLECDDDDCYLPPSVIKQAQGHSLIGQNVNLHISFPPTSADSHDTHTLFPCSLCCDKFRTDKKLKDHLKDIHNLKKPYPCEKCKFCCTSLKLLNRHRQRCEKMLERNKNTSISKLNGESVAIPRTCSVLTNSLISSPVQCVNDAVKNYQCVHCSFNTKSNKLLSCHVKTVHDSSRKTFHCDKCGFECKQNRTFLIHKKIHEKSQKVECDICQNTFVSEEKLKRHKLNHSEERPFKCVSCPSAFKFQGRLTDHVKSVHLKPSNVIHKKTFKCSHHDCGKVFRDNFNLNVHLKTHLDTKKEYGNTAH